MNSVFEKFKEFELSKEQSQKITGGSWLCHYGRGAASTHSNVEGALAACNGDSNCIYCEEVTQ